MKSRVVSSDRNETDEEEESTRKDVESGRMEFRTQKTRTEMSPKTVKRSAEGFGMVEQEVEREITREIFEKLEDGMIGTERKPAGMEKADDARKQPLELVEFLELRKEISRFFYR